MILLSNIGNRNIVIDNLTIPRYIELKHDNKNATFRDFTYSLLIESKDKTYNLNPEYQQRIGLNIIDKLVKIKKDEIEQIVLFYSDHPPNERNDQDTIFEAYIMQLLIQEKYQIPVQLKSINCKITDNEKLLRRYQSLLGQLDKDYPETKFLICDAGGTAQQKSALKIMSEFLFDTKRYDVYYVNQDNSIEHIPQIEYRKVIQTEQVLKLIDHLQYDACLKLLPEFRLNEQKKFDKLSTLLTHAFYRSNFNLSEAKVYSSDKIWPVKELVKRNYLLDFNASVPLGENEELDNHLHVQGRFLACELLAKCDKLLSLGKYNDFVLYLSIFCELVVNYLLKTGTGGKFNFIDDYHAAKYKFITKGKSDFPSLASHFKDEPIVFGMPALLIAADDLKDIPADLISTVKNFNSRFNNKIGRGLDDYRNEYAHRGIGVTAKEFSDQNNFILAGFRQLRKIFGMPNVNIYDRINNDLRSILVAP